MSSSYVSFVLHFRRFDCGFWGVLQLHNFWIFLGAYVLLLWDFRRLSASSAL